MIGCLFDLASAYVVTVIVPLITTPGRPKHGEALRVNVSSHPSALTVALRVPG